MPSLPGGPGKNALPTLDLKSSRHASRRHLAEKPATSRHGHATVAAAAAYGGDHVKPQPPPFTRRWPAGVPDNGVPVTARPTKSSHGSKHHGSNQSGQQMHPQGAMTARPPTGGRPRSQRQTVRQSPAIVVENNSTNSDLPMTPAKALKIQRDALSGYEHGEILDYPQVWFMGTGSQKIMSTLNSNINNYGYDDDRGDYHIILHDHLAFRYEVLSHLGKGSFGQVCKCFDYKHNKILAVKLIRNKKRFHHQALVEVKLLQYIKERDTQDQANIVHMGDYFYFRNHLCITFEVLSINLYELVKNNNFQGLSLGLIRRFAVQLLTSLRALRKLRIIHCDLKPENILLRQPNKSGIKIIDFGSSCFEDERVYTYIQSRFYRSPEVILGLPYDTAIDMWSFGCILAELYTGYPLFPGENEQEQLACVMEIFGVPPATLVDGSNRKKLFFEAPSGQPRIVANSRGKKRRPNSKELSKALSCDDVGFNSFLTGCLQWDPKERCTPENAIQHEWILEGLQGHHPPRSSRSSRAEGQSSRASQSNDKGASALPAISQGKPRRKDVR